MPHTMPTREELLASNQFHAQLKPQQWAVLKNDHNPGYDIGGEIGLISSLKAEIDNDEDIGHYVVSRRAARAMFTPRIIKKMAHLPEEMCTSTEISKIALGTQYDVFISFATQEELTMFRLRYSGNIGVSFTGH